MHKILILAASLAAMALGTGPTLAQSAFDGLYAGAQVGYGLGKYTFKDPTVDVTADGFSGGGFAGYGSLFSSYYFGIEGDFNASFVTGSHAAADYNVEAERPLAGSLSGRVGYAFSQSTMLFGKLGIGMQRFEITDQVFGSKASEWATGMRLGAGIETNLGSGLFARAGWDIDVASKSMNGVRMDNGVSQAGTIGLGYRW